MGPTKRETLGSGGKQKTPGTCVPRVLSISFLGRERREEAKVRCRADRKRSGPSNRPLMIPPNASCDMACRGESVEGTLNGSCGEGWNPSPFVARSCRSVSGTPFPALLAPESGIQALCGGSSGLLAAPGIGVHAGRLRGPARQDRLRPAWRGGPAPGRRRSGA